MQFAPGEFYYIPVNTDTKAPVGSWGGYPVNPDRELVCTFDQVQDSDHSAWGIVGNKKGNLLIIDVDLHKMGHRTKYPIIQDDFFDTLHDTTVVKSPSGGFHLYYEYDGDIKAYDTLENVDLCGDVGQRYAKSIYCDGYALVENKPPLPVDDTALAAFPVFQEPEELPVVMPDQVKNERTLLEPPCIQQAREEQNTNLLEAYMLSDKYRNGWRVPEGDIYDVLDETEYPQCRRVAAPTWMHNSPSATNSNFMVDENKETFRCWRDSVTGNVYHLIAIKHDIATCGDIGSFTSAQWQKTLRIAEQTYNIGYVECDLELTCQKIKAQGDCPVSCGRVNPHDV